MILSKNTNGTNDRLAERVWFDGLAKGFPDGLHGRLGDEGAVSEGRDRARPELEQERERAIERARATKRRNLKECKCRRTTREPVGREVEKVEG